MAKKEKVVLPVDVHIDGWLGASSGNKAIYKGVNVGKVLLTVLQILFLVLGIVMAFVGALILDIGYEDGNADLWNTGGDMMDAACPLLIMFGVMLILKSLLCGLDLFGTYKFSGYLKANNVNALPELKESAKSIATGSPKRRFVKVAHAASFSENKTLTIMDIVYIVFRLLEGIFLTVAVAQFSGLRELSETEKMLNVELGFNDTFETPALFYATLVIGLVCLVAAIVINIVKASNAKKWVEDQN